MTPQTQAGLAVAVPAPVKVTLELGVVASLVMEMDPVALPLLAGVNAASTMMLCAGDNVTGVPPPLTIEKPEPDALIFDMVTLDPPEFAMVTL